jgi:hypothetical protein
MEENQDTNKDGGSKKEGKTSASEEIVTNVTMK